MGAFLRQLAAMGVWATLSALLLPEGGARRAAQLVVGLMTTALLLEALGALALPESKPAFAVAISEAVAADGAVHRAEALRALANQAATVCERMARNAGYQARATVYLRESGAAERIELALTEAEGPLVAPDELARQIAEAFSLVPAQVQAVEP